MNWRSLLKLICLAPVAAPVLPKLAAAMEQRYALGFASGASNMFGQDGILRSADMVGGNVTVSRFVPELPAEAQCREAMVVRLTASDLKGHAPVIDRAMTRGTALPLIDDVGSGP